MSSPLSPRRAFDEAAEPPELPSVHYHNHYYPGWARPIAVAIMVAALLISLALVIA